MDGSMAAVVLDSSEIGSPMTDERLHHLMTQVWGKSFGKTSVLNKSKQVCCNSLASKRMVVSFNLPLTNIIVL
jgi:hypothetical protein